MIGGNFDVAEIERYMNCPAAAFRCIGASLRWIDAIQCRLLSMH